MIQNLIQTKPQICSGFTFYICKFCIVPYVDDVSWTSRLKHVSKFRMTHSNLFGRLNPAFEVYSTDGILMMVIYNWNNSLSIR